MTQTKRRILIVDDDADFAEALASLLEANGYVVSRARDGTEGLNLAKIERPDLILMDIVMRERTEGFFAVQEIRRSGELESVPVFVLTSIYAKEPEFKIAPDSGWLGHDEFFAKPVDPAELLEKIRQRLGAPAREAPLPDGRGSDAQHGIARVSERHPEAPK